MTEKLHIIDSLGERRLILPALINAALAANDRSKYYFTLLQSAASHAERPDQLAADLLHERLACGVADESLDTVVGGSFRAGEGAYGIPRAGDIVRALLREVDVMMVPLEARQPELAQRLALLKASSTVTGDVLSRNQIDTLASGNRDRGDSLHLLVMDAHKALNALQRDIATETVDGASCCAIAAADRPLIGAFMRGVRRTAPLKFDHPGLGTTATRNGARLVLQNDIGTTDAHVLVVHVEDRRVSTTYTDVHLQRLLFFQSLFHRFEVEWDDTVSRRDQALEDGVYHMTVGTFVASSDAQLNEFLEFMGSRLVFLIDWNRARKRLRALVSKDGALALLTWAAEHDYGHMAFLRAGGEQLIYDALDFVVKGEARFGERLDELLGSREALAYLQFVVKACSESLVRGEPISFIQDAARAELYNHYRAGQQLVFDVAGEHAAWIVEIASGLRDAMMSMRTADGPAGVQRNAERAKDWEGRADDLVNRARAASKRPGASDTFPRILEAADDIADALEEAAFRLTLLPQASMGGAVAVHLEPLAELLVQAAQEYVKVVEIARSVQRGGAREDMQDFLDAVHRIIRLEHDADAAQREVARTLAVTAEDFRMLHVLTEAAKNLEKAADELMHSGLRMRDYVLGLMAA
ncbi:MAG TPA: DUF47 family protein [Casimicrobiaceae bacterium]|nr:DUF47 family protein [Casimicrobiaceae bacterium]